MLTCVCLVIDYRRRQNVVRTSVTHVAIASCATCVRFCSYNILSSSVISYSTDTQQHGVYLFTIFPFFFPGKEAPELNLLTRELQEHQKMIVVSYRCRTATDSILYQNRIPRAHSQCQELSRKLLHRQNILRVW